MFHSPLQSKTIARGFGKIVLQLLPDPSIIRHRYITDILAFQKHTFLGLFCPRYLSPNLPHKQAATKIYHECCWYSPLFSLDMHPHHASRYFSGALRWKSISFAKQSGRLPQHRGVMESDGWPPYQEPRDKA